MPSPWTFRGPALASGTSNILKPQDAPVFEVLLSCRHRFAHVPLGVAAADIVLSDHHWVTCEQEAHSFQEYHPISPPPSGTNTVVPFGGSVSKAITPAKSETPTVSDSIYGISQRSHAHSTLALLADFLCRQPAMRQTL